MPELSPSAWLTVILVAALACLVLVVWRVLKGGTDEARDERDPEAPRNVERTRAVSEAKAAAPAHQRLSDAETAEVAELHGYFEGIGTGEHPAVNPGPPIRRRHAHRKPGRWQKVAARRQALHGFGADPLAAAIPGRHRVEEPVLFGDAVQQWFTPQLFASASVFPEPPAEPEPWLLDGFTGEWKAGTFNARRVGSR